MSWVFFSLLAATFFSASVIVDKILLNKYFHDTSVTALTAAAGIAGMPFLIILFFLGSISLDIKTFLVGASAGVLIIGAYQIYYAALKESDTALVSILFQLILPINFLLGVLIFDERPKPIQIIGLILMSLAATLVSLEEKESKWHIKWKIVAMMLGASFLAATSDAIYTYSSRDMSFINVAFSEYFGSVIFGLLLITVSKKVRRELKSIKQNIINVYGAIGLNEMFTLSGTLSLRYALFLGPLALIQGMLAAQPLITMFMVMALGLLGLKINESSSKHRWHLHQQILTSVMVIVAAVMITAPA